MALEGESSWTRCESACGMDHEPTEAPEGRFPIEGMMTDATSITKTTTASMTARAHPGPPATLTCGIYFLLGCSCTPQAPHFTRLSQLDQRASASAPIPVTRQRSEKRKASGTWRGRQPRKQAHHHPNQTGRFKNPPPRSSFLFAVAGFGVRAGFSGGTKYRSSPEHSLLWVRGGGPFFLKEGAT